jgi:hypothetical protein
MADLVYSTPFLLLGTRSRFFVAAQHSVFRLDLLHFAQQLSAMPCATFCCNFASAI